MSKRSIQYITALARQSEAEIQKLEKSDIDLNLTKTSNVSKEFKEYLNYLELIKR
jgi:hypothetical protein